MAEQVKRDLLMYAEDMNCGKTANSKDWAYVALLDMRHALNSQAPFGGDLALRQFLKEEQARAK